MVKPCYFDFKISNQNEFEINQYTFFRFKHFSDQIGISSDFNVNLLLVENMDLLVQFTFPLGVMYLATYEYR